jgi:hypothetical protein
MCESCLNKLDVFFEGMFMKFPRWVSATVFAGLLSLQVQAQDQQQPNAGQPGRLDLLTMEEKVANGQSFHTHQSEPVEPFRILGNIYYVGASNVASYLITSPDGHFLLDTGVQSMTATIKNSVEALGFQMQDIKILLYFHLMNAKKVKV